VLAIPPAEALVAMDQWNREHHDALGLTGRALASTLTVERGRNPDTRIRATVLRATDLPFAGTRYTRTGAFVRYMPAFDAYLHYRNIDVSTVKELVRRWYPAGPSAPEKKHAHLALDDIRESIDELRFYRRHFFRDV
jgi:oligoribonuclease